MFSPPFSDYDAKARNGPRRGLYTPPGEGYSDLLSSIHNGEEKAYYVSRIKLAKGNYEARVMFAELRKEIEVEDGGNME